MWYERLEVNRPIPPRAPSVLHTGITYKDTPSRKRKHRDDPEDEDEPRHFCRVRLISYRNRTRKEAVEQPQPEANGMDVYGMDGGDVSSLLCILEEYLNLCRMVHVEAYTN